MAQHDGVIANQGFPAFRSDLNDALAAIFSTHSGTTAPTGVVAGQFWLDTDTPSATVRTLFHYDGTDSIGIMQIDYTNNYVAKFGIGIQPSSMASGTMLHVKAGTSGATADTSADDFVIDVPGSGGMSINGVVGNNVMIALGDGTNGTGAALAYWNGTTKIMRHATNLSGGILVLAAGSNTEVARLDALKLLVGDTSDANVTQGVCINQGASDDSIFTGKSSDVAHNGTSGFAEADTYLRIAKRNATEGGGNIGGASEGECGIQLQGYESTNNATKSTAASGAVRLVGSTLLAGNVVGMQSANSNLVTISDNGTVRFIFDMDGDSHQDVGTAWTNFDTEDDSSLLVLDNDVMAQRNSVAVPEPEFFKRLRYLSSRNLWGYIGPRQWAKGIKPLKNYSATVRLLEGEAAQRANREAVYVQAQHEQSLRLRAAEERLGIPAGPTFIERCSELAVGRNVGRLPAPINLS